MTDIPDTISVTFLPLSSLGSASWCVILASVTTGHTDRSWAPGATGGHCLVLILAFIQPLLGSVPGAACRDHHSLSPSNNTRDTGQIFTRRVSVTALISDASNTLLSPDSWELSLHLGELLVTESHTSLMIMSLTDGF